MIGTYILQVEISKDSNLSIGRLGFLRFKKGFYYYFGSAMSSSGSVTLLNRVNRHLKKSSEKKKFWHIDYLLECKYSQIRKIILVPCKTKLECNLANFFSKIANDLVPSFGCSDCKCKSHLLYFEKPNLY
jgi:Uri superfamily endonuclease